MSLSVKASPGGEHRAHEPLQAHAANELDGEVHSGVVVTPAEHLRHVGVAQGCRQPDLVAEHVHELGVVRHHRTQPLHGR